MPKVSVIIPIYNSEKYLSEAILSILNQTFSDFELLLADDCSTDDTLKIAKSLAEKDQRITLLENEKNSGVSYTRNKLHQIAQGEFIAVMDADDVALPDRFKVQLDFLESNPDVVCVGSNHGLIDEHGHFLTTLELLEDDEAIQSAALEGHGSICHPCAMIRKSALDEIGGYDESLSSALDLDIWLKLGEIGKLANIQTRLLDYRLHSSSISGSKGGKQRLNARAACENAWQRRGIQGEFTAAEPWRPQNDKQSKLEFALKYGWWAYGSESFKGACFYAMKALRASPLASNAWKLLILSVAGRFGKSKTK